MTFITRVIKEESKESRKREKCISTEVLVKELVKESTPFVENSQHEESTFLIHLKESFKRVDSHSGAKVVKLVLRV